MMVPELSVVIPTLNRGKLLHDTVRQVLSQRFTDFELLLVDQSDATGRAANEAFVCEVSDARVVYVHLPVKGLPNARNEALGRVRGRIVLFLDDDVILLGDDFLDVHIGAYTAFPEVGGVTGRIVERSVRPNAKATSAHISPGGRTITNMWGNERTFLPSLKGANMSYRMEAVRAVGGFDRRYTGTALLEDTDYGYRVGARGWKLLYEPRAELVHLSAPSGGVRVEDAARAECARFRSTAYFVLKHRGVSGVPPFAATFGAIAMARALRWRDASAVPALWAAVHEGVEAWRSGPDEGIPGWEPSP
jgi:GT2 family glycosyltransferase